MKMLELSLIAAIVGFGFNKMLGPDMIFEGYKRKLDYWKHLGKKHRVLLYITKPLGLCIICNTTWIGFILSALLLPQFNIIHLLIVGMCAASFVIFIENLFKLVQKRL